MKYGTHCILEMKCDPKYLGNYYKMYELVCEAALISGADILKVTGHKFGEGQGVTILVLLSESHLSIHTWPETGYIAIDIFTCGDHCDPQKAINYIISKMHPKDHKYTCLSRGI